MKTRSSVSVQHVLVLCLIALLWALPGLGHAGTRAESDNFILVSDTDVEGAAILRDLERFRQAVIADLDLSPDPGPNKLTLTILDDTRVFNAVTPGGITAAIYLRSAAGQDIVIGYSEDPDHFLHRALEQDWLRLVLRHEVVHHIVEQKYARRLPIWLGEGLADYYATYDADGERLAIFGRALPDETELSRVGNWLPMRTVIESMAQYPDYAAATTDSLFRAQRLYYGQSWALAHYVMTQPEGLANIHRFVDDWDAASDSEDSFERAFGLRYEPLEARMRGRLGQAGSDLRVLDIGELRTGPISSGPATQAERATNRLRLLLSYARSGEETEQLMREAELSATTSGPGIQLARALHSWRMRDWAGADMYADALLSTNPQHRHALKIKAKTAYGRVGGNQGDLSLWDAAETAAIRALSVAPDDAQLHLFRVAVSLPENDRLPPEALASLDYLISRQSHLRFPHESMMMIPALIYEKRLDHADAVLDSASRWSDNRADQFVIDLHRANVAEERSAAAARAAED